MPTRQRRACVRASEHSRLRALSDACVQRFLGGALVFSFTLVLNVFASRFASSS
jgi:hypothetical protein